MPHSASGKVSPLAADDLASTLAGIKHDHRQHVSANFPAPGICVSRCADSHPRWPCGAYRAAAAAEAALKAVDELEHIDTAPPSGKEDEAAALGLRWCAAKVRAAIVCGLTGKETGDGG